MQGFTQALTLMGVVETIDIKNGYVTIVTLDRNRFDAYLGPTTYFSVLRNLDDLDTDRVKRPTTPNPTPIDLMPCYLTQGQLLVTQGIWQIYGTDSRYDVRAIYLLSSTKDHYLFEETHWWLTQTARLADQWLDSLFGDKRDYTIDDFVNLYRTDLNILGLQTDDDTQECAVLSRLIYGFSSAYLLTGQDRYRKAAEAGVTFQRDAFRSLSHDGLYCFWAFGRRKTRYGTQLLVPSDAGDDAGSIPLYEQIYALAGLAQYYRISLDPDVLDDISLSINTFNAFFLDVHRDGDPAFRGLDGWFSHIDYATLRPDLNPNPANNLKKNWNSVGDHIPAYLINVILALDPLPLGASPEHGKLLGAARTMLERATRLILEKFPDPDPKVPYVNERFSADWTPDHTYSWQQNRAIIGHNFKIAWNLTRLANYYDSVAIASCVEPGDANPSSDLAKQCMALATRLGHAMTEFGVDKIRGGCFDAVERDPSNGLPVEFTWLNTKDFWQQEQAILAYLILHGYTGKKTFLDMARRTEAFWNLFFLDREHRGIFFRLTDNGLPILDATYGVRGGHSDASGYHCFELAYLAHIYNRTYVAPEVLTDSAFCLYFQPHQRAELRSVNVLPDFMPPGRIRLSRVTVDGQPRPITDPYAYQIELDASDLGKVIAVEMTILQSPIA
jgi:mannose/cellobiose epimerase-like protein (N-acyl-D-glucosamine 2-epimerase family)